MAARAVARQFAGRECSVNAGMRRHPDELLVGLVSVSDRASAGVYADLGASRSARLAGPCDALAVARVRAACRR